MTVQNPSKAGLTYLVYHTAWTIMLIGVVFGRQVDLEPEPATPVASKSSDSCILGGMDIDPETGDCAYFVKDNDDEEQKTVVMYPIEQHLVFDAVDACEPEKCERLGMPMIEQAMLSDDLGLELNDEERVALKVAGLGVL